VQKYQLLPPLTQEEYEALKADIAERGVLVPVEYDEDGNILDGHHRVKACQELGIKEWPRLIRAGLNEDEKAEHVLKLNVHRRHLPKEWKQEKAKELRQQGWSYRRIARVLGVSHMTIERWLGKEGVTFVTPEAGNTVIGADGKQYPSEKPKKKKKNKTVFISEETAKKAQELPKERKEAVLLGKKKLMEAKREVKAEQISKAVELPKDKYRIIYADPPWNYGNTQPDYHTEQRDHYPTMTIEQLCEIPVKDICLDDAVLFLWATSPILEEVFEVIKAWGFKYKASFVWDKVKHNMGHYNSVRHEFLLVCTKRSCQPDVRKLFDSVYVEERTEHSRKPEYFRKVIDTLYPYGKRIELFSRRYVEGWDAYGNQI